METDRDHAGYNEKETRAMEVIILQGIPGSGKSTLAERLSGETGIILSADDYFVNADTGKY